MVIVREKHEAQFREGNEAAERFKQFSRAVIAVPKSEIEQEQHKYESKKKRRQEARKKQLRTSEQTSG